MSSDSETREIPQSGDPRAPIPATIEMLGKYEIQRILGSGGMGTVYLAIDSELKRTVALKVLPRERAENPILVRRFKSEAQSAAQLRHDNIVTVYEAGEANGLLFIALEYVDGRDVHEMIAAKGCMDVSQSAGIIQQTAVALQHAYEKGIVHRDIKPSNLMVDRTGVVKLADMGLARSVDDEESGITRDGTTVGTVDYMAPEQARNSKAADVRSDIYSLGCTWYHMLAGQVPFPAGDLTNKLFAHAGKERPDPRTLNPSVPAGVVEILHRMMEKSPKKRYQTPRELIEAIEGLRDVGVRDEEQEAFAAQLAAVVEATPELDDEERRSTPSTRSSVRTRAEGRKRKKSSRSAARPKSKSSQRRKQASGAQGSIVAAIGIVAALLVGGGTWWALSRPDTTPQNVTDNDPGVDPVDPDPVDPPPVDPPPVDPPPADPSDTVLPRITIGSPSERPLLPEWIAEVLLPEEAARPPGTWGLDVVGVGGDDRATARYRELEVAIESAPATGRAIRLNGPGPFVLDPLRVVGRRHLVVAGDPTSRSLVWIDGEEAGGLPAILELLDTSLTLVDLDIVISGRPTVGATPSVVMVANGDLVLRRCSVTFRDAAPDPMSAGVEPMRLFHVGGRVGSSAPRPPRVLFDRVFARGGNVTVLDAESAEFAGWGSLLATGTGPALRFGGAASPTSTARRIDLFRSTVYANRLGIALDVPDAASPPPTAVRVHDSIIATREPDGTLLRTTGWSIDGEPRMNRFELPGLKWVTEHSAYPGWDHSIHATAGDDERIVDGDLGWQRVLDSGVGSQQFPLRWPARLLGAIPATTPADFDPGTGSVERLRSEEGTPVGADIAAIAGPADEAVQRGAELARRPGSAGELFAVKGPQVDFEMGTQDLGRFLGSDLVPDGARVVVTGSGAHASTPIFLDGKSVRVEFRPDDGEELTVIVRGAKVADDERRAGRTEAFITVRNGAIDIEGGVFRMTAGSVGTPAEWFLHATDADFALRRCEVRGPVLEAKSLRELIRWEASRGSTRRGRAYFVDSFLTSTRPLLTGSLRNRTVVVRNSVLVGRETLFDFAVTGFDAKLNACVDVRGSTLCVDGTFFAINGRELPGEGAEDPLRFYADGSVFAEPVGEVPARGPVLFSVSEPVLRQDQVAWLGRDNAFTARMHAYLTDSAIDPPPAQTREEGWPGRERRPLDGRITFTGDAPTERASYGLDPGSNAARWRLDGGTVGAEARIGPGVE